MNRKLVIAALLCAAVIPTLAIHTCNSGWDDYYSISDDGGFVSKDGEPAERADALFARVMESVAEDEGCTLQEAVPLEGCYNAPATSRTRRGEFGFGAKVTWDCDGEEQVRHIVVGVQPSRKGAWKQQYLYNEDASGWPDN